SGHPRRADRGAREGLLLVAGARPRPRPVRRDGPGARGVVAGGAPPPYPAPDRRSGDDVRDWRPRGLAPMVAARGARRRPRPAHLRYRLGYGLLRPRPRRPANPPRRLSLGRRGGPAQGRAPRRGGDA